MLDNEIYKEMKIEIADITRNCGMDNVTIEVGLTNEHPIMNVMSDKGYPKVTVWYSMLPDEMQSMFNSLKNETKGIKHIRYVRNDNKPCNFLYVMRLIWNS